MQLIKDIIKTLKPTSFLKLGDRVSYLDSEIQMESKKDLNKYDLILIDCKRDYKVFTEYYSIALTLLSRKGIIVVNGGFPKYSALQNDSLCGKIWFWILSSGKKVKFFNDDALGLAIIKNKPGETIQGLNPDFTWFFNNVKPNTETEIKTFVKPIIKKKKDAEIL